MVLTLRRQWIQAERNRKVQEYRDAKMAQYRQENDVDLYSPLYDVSISEVSDGYTSDGIHLTHEGYTVITNEITPVLQLLLGK